MRLNILLIITTAFLFSSCTKEETASDRMARNEAEILEYLATNNITAIAVEDGLYVSIEEEGSDEKPSLSDDVTVRYKGYDANGNVFDESTAPIEFPLSQLITGWQIGIPYFGRGGKGKLLVPAHLGYGFRDPSLNNIIIFDIELINF